MAIWQGRSVRKPSGGRLRLARKKRKFEIGGEPTWPMVGEDKSKKVRTRGGNFKIKVTSVKSVNVTDPKTGKVTKSNVTTVVENAANPHFVQRNIITKGAIIKTDLGKAKVTSRPGQDGVVNAILIE